MEEAKRCELKLPVEIKRTTRIRCGGRVPTGAIASRNPVKEEKVPTPVRRLVGIEGMKRKDYKEVSPEPKDYGGSDYSDDRSPSSWAAAGRDCKTPDFHRKPESLYHRDSPWISGYRVQNVSRIDIQSHTSHHIKLIVH
jgi:hypothetical protein